MTCFLYIPELHYLKLLNAHTYIRSVKIITLSRVLFLPKFVGKDQKPPEANSGMRVRDNLRISKGNLMDIHRQDEKKRQAPGKTDWEIQDPSSRLLLLRGHVSCLFAYEACTWCNIAASPASTSEPVI